MALYARVSSADQKLDWDRQLARWSQFAAGHHLSVVESLQEMGSGLNGHRRIMLRLLKNPKIQGVVVEHRERLLRFGFEYVEAARTAYGGKIMVIESDEVEDDMVRDLHEVLAWMGARLYGKRAARNRAAKALEAIRCP